MRPLIQHSLLLSPLAGTCTASFSSRGPNYRSLNMSVYSVLLLFFLKLNSSHKAWAGEEIRIGITVKRLKTLSPWAAHLIKSVPRMKASTGARKMSLHALAAPSVHVIFNNAGRRNLNVPRTWLHSQAESALFSHCYWLMFDKISSFHKLEILQVFNTSGVKYFLNLTFWISHP